MNRSFFLKTLLITGAIFYSSLSYCQSVKPPVDPQLYKTIAALDSVVFNAYNTCDLIKFESFFADDVEFYHDKGGVMTDKKAIIEASRKNICGKVERKLDKETLEVFPVNKYGAIETGSHRFKNYGQGDTSFGKPARFLHIWQFSNGSWKITRVISYDHQ